MSSIHSYEVKNYIEYAKENVFENVDEVKNILELAMDDIYKKFDIKITRPEQALAIFSIPLRQCMAKLYEKRDNNYSKYKIIVANRFEIGYDNSVNPEYEKNGGFVAYMKHLYHEKNDNVSREYGEKTIELCTAWNSVNIITDTGIIKEIAVDSFKILNRMDIKLASSEVIMPMMVSIYEAIVDYMRIRRAEMKEPEYRINFASLFEISASESDDMEDVIVFTPTIESKLMYKSDAEASAKYE